MWTMLSFLIMHQSQISCRFHVRKIRILLIFSWVNDFRKNINKSNITWFTRSCSWICCSSGFTEKYCVVTKIWCVLLAFIFPDRVWCWWHIIKQIFHAFFCLISKLFTLGNIIFNSALRRWILITSVNNFWY